MFLTFINYHTPFFLILCIFIDKQYRVISFLSLVFKSFYTNACLNIRDSRIDSIFLQQCVPPPPPPLIVFKTNCTISQRSKTTLFTRNVMIILHYYYQSKHTSTKFWLGSRKKNPHLFG